MSTGIKTIEVESAFDELENLLERQIGLARQGRIRDVETLIEQAGGLIDEIAEKKKFQSDDFQTQYEHLGKLYKELYLILAAQKAAAGEELNSVHKSKKTIRVYRENI